MAGISRVHGLLLNPKNFAGVSLKDFTLTFWEGETSGELDLDADTPNGALDQIFRNALSRFASVSRVGTLNTSTKSVRFAIETLGGDGESDVYLGLGPTNDSPATVALALQGAVRSLGTVNGIACSSATVVEFVY
jgi:ribosomal protein S5